LFLVVPGSAHADGFGFMTPSTNIYCNGAVSGGGELFCTIINRSGPTPLPKPQSCNGVWGHEFSLKGHGRAMMICGPRPQPVDYSDIAEYGVSANFGDVTCHSERTGFTCTNADGHGFFLSRRKQLVF
jgi:hypothetical protein